MIRALNVINRTWFKSFFSTIILVYLYVFMEWLFYATMPSFMSSMDTFQEIVIFFVASFFFLIPALVLTIITNLIARYFKLLTWVSQVVPAVILTMLTLLLADNFTYTVFKFGIVTSKGIWRGTYAVILFLAFMYILVTLARLKNQNTAKSQPSPIHYFAFFLLAASIVSVSSQFSSFNFGANASSAASVKQANLPNIILLGMDGVNATNMSVYGYERDTTPNITELSKDALIVNNAYSNAGNTTGSLTSILTGKLPTETRVYFSPDILMGGDAYRHLPGILKQLGYSTVQITSKNYSDAYSLNIKGGFDTANFRSESVNPFLDQIGRLGGGGSFYFGGLIIQRATERLEHILYINTMINPYEVINKPATRVNEQNRYKRMIKTIKDAEQPLFINVHMLTTHGPTFAPRKSVFSLGETQDKEWILDFYDDAILDSDRYVGDLFNYLNSSGKIKNTIVILYSDHGAIWDPTIRVPLIIWFPNKEFSGTVNENVQMTDIAPTILDFIHIQKPIWMSGQSLISQKISSSRMIFSVRTTGAETTGGVIDKEKISPPFFQINSINLINCNQRYSLQLRKPYILVYSNIIGSTILCDKKDSIPSPEQAIELILQHLGAHGYDISSFPKNIPIVRK